MNTGVVQTKDSREIDIQQLGKVFLEEILFRAARKISASAEADEVKITFDVYVSADTDEKSLRIKIPGDVEKSIVTRLPLPE